MTDLALAADRACIRLRDALGDGPIGIFIDPTLSDPLAEGSSLHTCFVRSQRKGVARASKLNRIHDNFDPQRQPCVVFLDSEAAAEHLFLESVHLSCQEALGQGMPAQARTVCGWFNVRGTPAHVVAALAAHARIIKPDGQPWYLRYWDPRVIWHLPRVLDHYQLQRLRHGLGNWQFLDSQLNVQGWPDAPEQPGSFVANPHRVSPSAWIGLQRIEAINRVMGALADWGLRADEATARQIEAHFETCASLGFAASDDAVTFACAAMVSHPQMHQHPAVAAALARAPTVSSALSHFDDDFWNQLREGRWFSTTAAKGSTPA